MQRVILRLPFACLLATIATAQSGVRLTRVPELVRLPAAAGSNLLLEVEVDGAASEVWLGSDLASRDRVALVGAGEKRWQLNLAEPRVAAMLPAGRDGGELFVFATIGGSTKPSAAIAWSRTTSLDGKLRCLLRTKQGTTEVLDAGGSAWLDVAQLGRIEVQGATGRQSTAVARLGELEVPLHRQADGNLWVLDGGPALQPRLREAETIEIEAKLGASSAVFHFAVVPRTLQLPEGGAPCVVQQRQRAAVPGSKGWLFVSIGDITMGSTLLRVTNAEGHALVPKQLLHERDFVELVLAEERYVLVVENLVNLLVGDDRAELRILPAAGFVPDRIGQLIRAVGASADTFVREGTDYPGAAAMQLLVAKVGSHRGPPVTLDEFIDQLASTSSKTGQPYEVRRQDGTTVPMQQWLRATLRELEAPSGSTKK